VIFLVDDDDGSRDAMTRTLERVGYSLRAFASAEEALEKLREGEQVDAVVSDVRMPGMDGYEFLREVRAEYPKLPFLLVTAYADVEDAVAALQEGADDYLTKPVKVQELRQRVQLQLERRVLSEENRRLRQRLEKSFGFEGIVGHSTGMEERADAIDGAHRRRVGHRQGTRCQRPPPELAACPGAFRGHQLWRHSR
jgi:DNA-binding NtrC family response regulator